MNPKRTLNVDNKLKLERNLSANTLKVFDNMMQLINETKDSLTSNSPTENTQKNFNNPLDATYLPENINIPNSAVGSVKISKRVLKKGWLRVNGISRWAVLVYFKLLCYKTQDVRLQ
jgi:hypothetical protein